MSQELLEEYKEYYPAAVLSEQDTYASYWHSLAHLIPETYMVEWFYLTATWIARDKNMWN